MPPSDPGIPDFRLFEERGSEERRKQGYSGFISELLAGVSILSFTAAFIGMHFAHHFVIGFLVSVIIAILAAVFQNKALD